MSWGNWNVALPADHTQIKSLPEAIRDVESSTKIIFTKEHVVPGTSQAGGQHVLGSCRVYLDSAAPTTDPEGNSLATGSDTSDNGRVAVLTGSSNCLKIYIATSAGISTGFQPVLCERVKLAETMYGGGRVISDIATGTQSGQAIHMGQIDTTYFQGVSTGTLQPKIAVATLSTGLATASTRLIVTGAPGFVPTEYANDESVTLPNGLVMKFGTGTLSSFVATITFASAFATALKNVQVTMIGAAGTLTAVVDDDPAAAVTGFSVTSNSATGSFYWMAVGY